MKPINHDFFARDTLTVAKELLGKIIVLDNFQCRIVETEAYGRDQASHAYKKTDRSSLMFDTFGFVYVYLIYGLYYCLNFTADKDEAGAVLIRAVEPLKGIEEMKRRRKTEIIPNLCSGPGKLCLAMGINKDYNGSKIGEKIKLFDDGFIAENIGTSPRIGIKDALDLEWRFFIKDNKFVSKNYKALSLTK